MANESFEKKITDAINNSHRVSHYLHLFWRHKLYILVTGFLTGTLTVVLLVRVFSVSPRLSATSIIGIENTENITAVKETGGYGKGRGDLITSRAFLKSIVDTMSLKMVISKFNRHEIFTYIKMDSTLPEGTYSIVLDKKSQKKYAVYYQKSNYGKKIAIKEAQLFSHSGGFSLQGIQCTFSEQFLSKPHSFSFSVNSSGYSINDLMENITIQDIDMPRNRFNIIVSVSGTDYQLITDCANIIAEVFVQRNFSYKKVKSQKALEILEEQFQRASKELQGAETALKNFRTRHPRIGLTTETIQTVTSISGLETDTCTLRNDLDNASTLQEIYLKDTGEAHIQTAIEVLAFLSTKNIPFTQVLQNELSELLAQRNNLYINRYSSEHPLSEKNRIGILNTLENVGKTLENFIDQTNARLQDNAGSLKGLQNYLGSLPGKELALAQLQRKQQICLEIYTLVMNRYNQAKVADASIVTDVFVMEKALEPEPPPLKLSQILLFGMLAALLCSLGPVLLYDRSDKTVRNIYELNRLSDQYVLESIPVIMRRPKLRSLPDKKSSNSAIHCDFQRLTTNSDQSQDYINEILRALRTKILMKLRYVEDKSMVITSIEPGVGKTTLACNIAKVIAQTNMRTILIDGDMRCGRMGDFFACQNDNGLTELLSSREIIDKDSILKYIKSTDVQNLSIITSGVFGDTPSELLSSSQLSSVKRILSTMFDIVIMDCPPIGTVSDAAVVCEYFSHYCIVVKAGVTNVRDMTSKLKEYPLIEKKVIGIVLNFSALDKNLKYYRMKGTT
jgi:capsular exopolysaccharide synthesis family protein